MLAACPLILAGCRSLHVSGHDTVQTSWNSFHDAKSAFDRVQPGISKKSDLAHLGFDPYKNPNVRVLTYLDIQQRFLPNESVRFESLPSPVQHCLAARENSLAYEVDTRVIESRRHGNLFMDMLSFDRKTEKLGWSFQGLILLHGDQVVYKLWSGQPNIAQYSRERRPLGPLQELEGRVAIPVGW